MKDRWSIEALVARYELHPAFREVFVEGESDKGLVQWFLQQSGCADVLVYPVTSVGIPTELMMSRDLDLSSRRSGIIVLALELESRLTKEVPVTCVADADFEAILPKRFVSRFLMYTDYTSIEMYGFRPDLVEKVLRIVAPSLEYSGAEVLHVLTSMLEHLFVMRAANYSLRLGLSWISFEKVSEVDGLRVVFDDREFLTRYLNTKGKLAEAARLRRKMEELKSNFHQDPRFQIRGHDFVELLTWYLRKQSTRSCRNLTVDTTRQILVAQLTSDELKREMLFRDLLTRYV